MPAGDVAGEPRADWKFLTDAGFDCAVLSKGRMRPATFWRRDRFALCKVLTGDIVSAPSSELAPSGEEPGGGDGGGGGGGGGGAKGADGILCCDRTLTTLLRMLDPADGTALATRPSPIAVVNAHLTAGPNAPRRLRQVHEALETYRKLKNKAAKPIAAAADAVVVAGDFNSQGHSAVRELLTAGEVLPAFRESGDPTEREQGSTEITSKAKKQPFGAFGDALGDACERAGCARPPTMVVQDLMATMLDEASGDEGTPSAAMTAALDECFDGLSADGAVLTEEEERAWLIKINKQVGRGSEFRAAQAPPSATALTRADFHSVYQDELAQGKFWGVEHDLCVMRGRGLHKEGSTFTADFDYVYYTKATLRLEGVQALLPEAQMEQLLAGTTSLPNEFHPSDHLPLAAAFAFESTRPTRGPSSVLN